LKVLVIGGTGKIGSTIAWDLIRDKDVEAVGIVGRTEATLGKIRDWIASDKLELHTLDVMDRGAAERLVGQYDLCINTLPDRRSSYRALEVAIDCGIDALDVMEEYHRRPDNRETEGLEIHHGMSLEEYGESLHRRAVDNGVTILDGMGFAPGLSNVTLAHGIKEINAHSAEARVGGIPDQKSAQRHPLKYIITWSFAHVLREYSIKVLVKDMGRVVEVNATNGREVFRFNEFGHDVELECAITPGMPSFLYTFPQLQNFSEKTIRWPGHFDGIDALRECGLLSTEEVNFKGAVFRPRDFLVATVGPKLKPLPGDKDVCIMWNTAYGEMDGDELRYDCYMWSEGDETHGISAMSRVTGFSAASGARLLGRGYIKEKGIVAPEEVVAGDLYRRYMNDLREKNIKVFEVTGMASKLI